MVWRCYLCGNKRDPVKKVALHQFPSKKNDDALKQWLDACNLAETDNVSQVRICSSHFLPEDFLSNPIKLRLRTNAIPTQNLKCESGIDSDDDVLLPSLATNNRLAFNEKVKNSSPVAFKSNPISTMTLTTINGASKIILTNPQKIIDSKQLKIIDPRPLKIIDPKQVEIINPQPLKIVDSNALKISNPKLLNVIDSKQVKIINSQPLKIIDSTPFNIEKLRIQMNALNKTQMPHNWGFCNTLCGLFFNYFGDTFTYPTRSIWVKPDMNIEVRGKGIQLPMVDFNKIQCLKDIIDVMLYVSTLHLCSRTLEIPCDGLFQTEHRKPRSPYCCPCRTEMKRTNELDRRRIKRKVEKTSKAKKKMRNMRMKLSRAINTVETLKTEIEELKKKTAVTSETVIAEMLKTLPIEQQEAVKTCITAAKCKGPNGIRYSNSFILECLLLKMKSRRAYLHIRDHNILSLPSLSTLTRYLNVLKPSFGFREETFSAMKMKAEATSLKGRRGVLLLNEMKLNDTVLYDLEKLKTMGFSNLSEYNPNDKKKELGDHGLVFVFQPFLGTWSQNVGSFLKKGCANSEAIYKLVLECIILLENTGFKVDVVTTINTVSNRAMWKRFGLTKFDNYCNHPCGLDDENNSRRLFFCLDFPYLLENLRNFLISAEEIWTPNGIIKVTHFRAILHCDERVIQSGSGVVHKLTVDHLTPTNSHQMNIKMAIQLFSIEVATAMESYKSHHQDLNDCDHTIKFIHKIHRFAQIMTSKSDQDTLLFGNDGYKAILDLREYLEEWEYEAKLNNLKFIPSNTYEGLWITLTTVINIMDFLITDCDHGSLMASRLNQDVLGVTLEINQTTI